MRQAAVVLLIVLILFSSSALIFFSLDTTSEAVHSFPQQKMVLAYYYGWYTNSSWYGGIDGPSSLAVADVPALGLYNSQNVTVIDTQISEAQSAGMNGFIASWWGPGSFTDNTDQILLNQASSRFDGFEVSLYFETAMISNMNTSQAVEGEQIVNDVSYIMQTYSGSDAFMQLDGKPVLFFYGVDNWPLEFWTGVNAKIHSSYPSLLLVSDSLNESYLSVFDGAASYVDLGFMTQSITLQNGTYPFFTAISQLAKSEGKYWFADASPGFNGTNDGRTQFTDVPRDGGDTFIRGWDIAQNSDPDGIIVGTWNEYFEGTSIEPTVSYGDLYLELTSQLATAWIYPALQSHSGFSFSMRLFPEGVTLQSV